MKTGPTTCRSCGAHIIFALTVSDRVMPVDAEATEDGNLLLDRIGGEWRVFVSSSTEARHRAHFATCPDADSWRRR